VPGAALAPLRALRALVLTFNALSSLEGLQHLGTLPAPLQPPQQPLPVPLLQSSAGGVDEPASAGLEAAEHVVELSGLERGFDAGGRAGSSGACRLELLDASWNAITALEGAALARLGGLRVLRLAHNLLAADEALEVLRWWVRGCVGRGPRGAGEPGGPGGGGAGGPGGRGRGGNGGAEDWGEWGHSRAEASAGGTMRRNGSPVRAAPGGATGP
jgi:hypothetical protein